jgi:hypothetical protein
MIDFQTSLNEHVNNANKFERNAQQRGIPEQTHMMRGKSICRDTAPGEHILRGHSVRIRVIPTPTGRGFDDELRRMDRGWFAEPIIVPGASEEGNGPGNELQRTRLPQTTRSGSAPRATSGIVTCTSFQSAGEKQGPSSSHHLIRASDLICRYRYRVVLTHLLSIHRSGAVDIYRIACPSLVLCSVVHLKPVVSTWMRLLPISGIGR